MGAIEEAPVLPGAANFCKVQPSIARWVMSKSFLRGKFSFNLFFPFSCLTIEKRNLTAMKIRVC
jgi:hypothetical protein